MNAVVVVSIIPLAKSAAPPTPTMTAPTQAKGKMFATAIAYALAESVVVVGILPVGYKPTLVLFDFGCTHSFVLPGSKEGIEMVSLGHSF